MGARSRRRSPNVRLKKRIERINEFYAVIQTRAKKVFSLRRKCSARRTLRSAAGVAPGKKLHVYNLGVIAEWAWELVELYLRKRLQNRHVERPTKRQLLEEFAQVWPEFTATILVQEPFMGTIRFKRLIRLAAAEMNPFLEDPVNWIGGRFGGGKFKMNLHHGMHFVNTKNFKPEGPPTWKDLPEPEEE
jgi:hypothetical protein